ncbi:ABC-type sugar transport system, periplasmic component [Xenococcus sp. PCC 7305]|nr:ABC-type sugar transport system, periplasmic component [Xenococcus sp. PCC 7305]
MWGIGSFGGTWFDSNNRFVLQGDSVSRWLKWLKQAQQIPMVYLDKRRDVMFDLFSNSKLAYFPCWTFEYISLQEQLGDQLAVAPLPSGEEGAASPILETDTLVLNTYATQENKKLAIDFARFITQGDQQIALISAKEHTITPANSHTVVDERLLPRIAIFAESASHAIPFPISDISNSDRLRFYGDILYRRVLQEEIPPDEAVKEFFEILNNPPHNEKIDVFSSAAGKEVTEIVLVDVQPNINFLIQLFHIQREILKRPVVLFQILLIAVVLLACWFVARYLNKWFNNLIARFIN